VADGPARDGPHVGLRVCPALNRPGGTLCHVASTSTPDSGTELITYEGAADIGVFDGRLAPGNTSPKISGGSGIVQSAVAGAEPAGGSSPKGRRWLRRQLLVPYLVGVVLVAAGVAAVGYGLYGLVVTDFVAAREQANLSQRFDERRIMYAAGEDATFDVGVDGVDPVAFDDFDDEVPVMEVADDELSGQILIPGAIPEDPPARGDALGRLVIPKIDVDWTVIEGVGAAELRKGPGHLRGSALPGQYGNSVLSGHRTTYGGPFSRIDELEPGDRFTVETLIGTHTYEVVSSRIVAPSHSWVVHHRAGAWMTLTTCHPKFSSQQRLIVFAKLVDGPNIDAVTDYHGTVYDAPEPPEGTSEVPRYTPPTTIPDAPAPIALSVARPAGSVAGDLLLAQVTAQGGASTTISAPAGWSVVRRDNVGEDLAQAIFRRIVGPGEPSGYEFTVNGATSAAAAAVTVAGVDASDPLYGSRGATGSGTGLTAPGIAAEGPSTAVVFFGILAETSLSTPQGFEASYTAQQGATRILAARRTLPEGGTLGATSGAGASGTWIAQTILVRPLPAPAPETTTTTMGDTTTTTMGDTTTTTMGDTTTTTMGDATTTAPTTTTSTTGTTTSTSTTTTTIPTTTTSSTTSTTTATTTTTTSSATPP
jgi:sortase A